MSGYEYPPRPAPSRNPPPPPLSAYLWPALFFLLLAVVVVWRFWPGSWRLPGTVSPMAAPREVAQRGPLWPEEERTIALYEKVSPSVVHVTALARHGDGISFNIQEVPKGTGTGFIWSKEGHVVTNFHVIEGAARAKVQLADATSYNARVVGSYPDKDLAVLQIDAPASKLVPIEIGTSSNLKVGQFTFAIGNPFGLDQTLTTGIISAVNREIESMTRRPIRGVIQTDAAINPGNSGGPLLDSSGLLIGVNTAIYSPSGVSAGIGFAIPVDEVNRIVPQLIEKGKVVRPGLGVQVASDELIKRYRLPGVLVVTVMPDSPAAKAGIQPTRRGEEGVILGDIIVAVEGKPTRTSRELFKALDGFKVGDNVNVKVVRNEEEIVVPVVLEAIE